MAGSVSGGRKAANKNKAKYGEDFYQRIGAMGGKNGTTGGFYANRELASEAGARGGAKSRRGRGTNSKYYFYSNVKQRWYSNYPNAPVRSFDTEAEVKTYVAKLKREA